MTDDNKGLAAGGMETGILAWGSGEPEEVLAAAAKVATAICSVIRDRQLYHRIGDRDHVLIEGWQMMGAPFGVFAQVSPNGLVKSDEGGGVYSYMATAEAVHAASGRVVARASAVCRSDETLRRRSTGEVYQRWSEASHVAGMAQTRACSRALAGALRWVMVLEGFAGTPAEDVMLPGADPTPGRAQQRHAGDSGGPGSAAAPPPQRHPPQGNRISDPRAKRLWAILYQVASSRKVTREVAKSWLDRLLDSAGYNSVDEILVRDYEQIIAAVQEWATRPGSENEVVGDPAEPRDAPGPWGDAAPPPPEEP